MSQSLAFAPLKSLLRIMVLPIFLLALPGHSDTVDVVIKGHAFVPAEVTIKTGDVIRWTNQDAMGHTATASDGEFDTGNLSKNAKFSVKFDEAGTFDYTCELHPSMLGKIIVEAASSIRSRLNHRAEASQLKPGGFNSAILFDAGSRDLTGRARPTQLD